MKYMLIVDKPNGDVQIVRHIPTIDAAWKKADIIYNDGQHRTGFSFKIIPDLDEISAAHTHCGSYMGCSGCAYDGICCTRSDALVNDTKAALEAMAIMIRMLNQN